jgi:periplasmic protein TonB
MKWKMTITLAVLFAVACNPSPPAHSARVFEVVDDQPQFPGGADSLTHYLFTGTQYPASALADSVQGTVVVAFVVDELGNVGQIQVAKGIHPDCDSAAAAVIRAMPRWKPGTIGGIPVKVRLYQQLIFTLNGAAEHD